MNEGTVPILNSLLSADWNLPTHYEALPDYGTALAGGAIKFGFKCAKCQSIFRHDYKSIGQFDAGLNNLLAWADEHRHETLSFE